MEFLWWQVCILQLCKGISWSIPIWAIVLAASWFMSNILKEPVDKARKKLTSEE
jgi:hypothetical protein